MIRKLEWRKKDGAHIWHDEGVISHVGEYFDGDNNQVDIYFNNKHGIFFRRTTENTVESWEVSYG